MRQILLQKTVLLLTLLMVFMGVCFVSLFPSQTFLSGATTYSQHQECCDVGMSHHEMNRVAAIGPVFLMPGLTVVFFLSMLAFSYFLGFSEAFLPYSFHKFSRGVVQIE